MASFEQGGSNGSLLIYTSDNGHVQKYVISHIVGYHDISNGEPYIEIETCSGREKLGLDDVADLNAAITLLDGIF